jgi:hypothetical protein
VLNLGLIVLANVFDVFFITDFMNFKINSIRSFQFAHIDKMCVHRDNRKIKLAHSFKDVYIDRVCI